MVLADLVSGESFPLGLCPHLVHREKDRQTETEIESTCYGIFSYKGTNPTLRTHPMNSCNPHYILKAPFPNTITLRVKALTYEF